MYAALISYVGKCGVPCCRVGGRLDGPSAIRPSWRILCPNRGSFEGGSAVDGRDVFKRARGSC
jgi:hypothetical protein